MTQTLRHSIFPLLAALLISGFPSRAQNQKLTAEVVLQRHLDSIGSADKRAAVKTRSIEGSVRMKVEVGTQGPAAQGLVAGTLSLISSGGKYRIALPFNYADYWGEQFVCDGAKATVAFSYIQQRSPLADFIYRYDMILQEGLFGGTLSTAWPLLDVATRQPKLEYAGMRTVNGQQLHVLNYRRKKGQADMRIELFFDSETFRHVRTAYNIQMLYENSSGALESQQRQQPSFYRLEEFFSGFREFDGFTLPTRWNVFLERSGGNRTTQREYAIIIDKVLHNEPVEDGAFKIEQRRK